MTSRGFTIIEVLVTVAALGLASLATLSLNEYLTKDTQLAAHKANFSAAQRLIQERLNDPMLCGQTLGSGSSLGNAISLAPSSVTNVQLRIPNIQAGPTMSSDVIGGAVELQPLKLKIDTLQLRDTQKVNGLTYLANLYLKAHDWTGFQFHESLVGAITMNLDPSGTILTCYADTLQDSAEICAGMGCTFNPASSPSCVCTAATPQPCAAGSYPVSYDSSGVPTCKTLGGSCTGTNYVTGVHLGGAACASAPPAPTTCPSTPVTWTVGGVTCSATLPATGVSTPATVTSASPSGSATYNCLSTGLWNLTPTATSCTGTCAPPASFTWSVGADTCTAPGVPAPYGSSVTVSDSVADPSTGSATYSCSMAGVWSGPASPSCASGPSCPAGSSLTGSGGALPAPNGSCRCNLYQDRWDAVAGACTLAHCSCGGKIIAGRTWIPCGMGGTTINTVTHMCDVGASQSNIPSPPMMCGIGNPTWSCAYFP